jgi:hypothetical protein
MSSKTNKTRLLGAAITLVTAGVISISAQTTAAVKTLTTKPDSIREVSGPALEKKSEPAAEPAALTEPTELSQVNPGSKASDSANAHHGPKAAEGAEAEGGRATARAVAASPQTTSSDKWQFQVTPYFWLVSLHGNTGIGNRTAGVDMSFGDVFGSLKFALMGVFEARKGKLVLLTDAEYAHLEDDKATPGPLFSDVTAGFKQFIFSQEAGYRVYESDKGSSVDVLGGIRVWHVSTELDFGAGILPAQNLQGSRNWVDGIGGIRGKAALSEKIFLTGKFDLGAGESDFTWQLFGGLGYGITPKIALIGGYRVLDVDYNKNNFIYDLNQRGPIFGIGFKF